MKGIGLFLASLVCLVSASSEMCPASCTCNEMGLGPFVAQCSKLDTSQKFGDSISRVVVENDDNLVLNSNTFTTVGLQFISTLQFTNCTFKKLDPRAFSSLQDLRILVFETNKQLTLHPDMFNETSSLFQLILRHNRLIFSKNEKYLFDIKGLKELEISGADLSHLPSEAFSKMPNLEFVGLSSNRIKNIETQFWSLPLLEEVNLSNNLIGKIDPDVFNSDKTPFIDILKMSGNPLTTLQGLKLPIVELDISFCKFTKIDYDTFSGFEKLQIFNLSGNAISKIHEEAFRNMSNLRHIDLSRNALDSLPQSVFHPKITVLSLAHNPTLLTLPNIIFEGLTDLIKLDLSFCGLSELNENHFKGLQSLMELNLAGNMLSRLNPGVLTEYIINLDLSHNSINYLEQVIFPLNSRIRKLNLADNALYDISTLPLMNLSDLEKLDLSSCKLNSSWDVAMSPKLGNLAVLSLAKNMISSVSIQQMAITPRLQFLGISDNPLTCNNMFISTMQWLKAKGVKPISQDASIQSVFTKSAPMHSEIINIGSTVDNWSVIESLICQEVNTHETDKDNAKLHDSEYDEDEEESEDEDYSLQDDLDSIVERKIVHDESSDKYFWPLIITSIFVITSLLSLITLSAFVLRWSRQRNSYGAQMIKNLNSSKLKRDRSTIYQQLYEDSNQPTTPVMSMKQANQIQYNFPERLQGKQVGYITYLSKNYHDNTVIPENV